MEYRNNLAMTQCKFPREFEKTDKLLYAVNEEPTIIQKPNNYQIINPNFGLMYSPFIAVKCPEEGRQYINKDPRLFDPLRNINMTLDRPPFQGDLTDNYGYQQLQYVYDPRYIRQGYGRGFSTYKDIDAGQDMYYMSTDSVNDAYFHPVFIIRNRTDKVLYRDPMSAIKPQFFRTPLTESLKYLSDDQYARDTISFREDIMSRQMSKMNSQSYQKTN